MNPSRHTLSLLLLLWAASVPAHAYLGGFEAADGYHISLSGGIASSQPLVDAGEFTQNGYLPTAEYGFISLTTLAPDFRYGPDLSRYNAGQYTGSLPLDIVDNGGLWTSLYGGRLVEDDFGGPWDGWGSDYAAATSVMAHGGQQSLALRAMDDSIVYRYALEARDIQAASAALQYSFWINPSALDNSFAGNIFSLGFADAAGAALFEVGYTGDDFLEYRFSGQGQWTTTHVQFGNDGWSQVSIILDGGSDLVSLSAARFDDTSHTLEGEKSVITAEALSLHQAQPAALTWTLQGGYLDNTSLNGAHYFDDFTIATTAVPEPGSAVLLLLVTGFGCLRRRR